MKKYFVPFFISFTSVFFTIFYLKNIIFANSPAKKVDFIEENFPLVKIKSPYFINDLSYNKEDNFLKHPFYHKFGINDCYVHIDIYENIKKLESILKEKNLRAMMFDCFRPQEAQIYMWELNPNPKFLANPHKKGSLHSKGLALDIGLADINGKKLEFATGVDHFVSASSHNYKCQDFEKHKCENRALLKSIMEQAGFRGIKHEWWHYQKKGDTSTYPLISICNHPNSKCEDK